MRIHLYSDLHLDHYSDKGAKFLKEIKHQTADVAVLAGDITTGKFADNFRKLFLQFKDQYAHTLVIPGNHEPYGTSPQQVERSYNLALKDIDNVHVLDSKLITIDGQRFIGGTMWYIDGPMNAVFEGMMNDIHYIKGFKPWVYNKQQEFELLLRKELMKDDVVITHHLPSYKSVNERYRGSSLNRFFVCEMDWIIYERKPKLWLHGHSHSPCDYFIEETRVVCNPRGYPRENSAVYGPKEIEL